jgi:hypothetical protein
MKTMLRALFITVPAFAAFTGLARAADVNVYVGQPSQPPSAVVQPSYARPAGTTVIVEPPQQPTMTSPPSYVVSQPPYAVVEPPPVVWVPTYPGAVVPIEPIGVREQPEFQDVPNAESP